MLLGWAKSLRAQSVGEVSELYTCHACNFQDAWKWKSARPTTSQKASYAPGWKEYVGETARTFGVHYQFCNHTDGRHPTSSAIQEHTKATVHKFSLDSARILTRRKNVVTRKIRDAPRCTKGTWPLTGNRATMLRLCCSVSCRVTKVVAWLNMDACTLKERQSCCLINLTVLLSFNLYLSCKFIFQYNK